MYFTVHYIYIYIWRLAEIKNLVPPCARAAAPGTRLPGTRLPGTRSPAQGQAVASMMNLLERSEILHSYCIFQASTTEAGYLQGAVSEDSLIFSRFLATFDKRASS